MKLAWIVQKYEDDEDIQIMFEEPASWYFKVTPIVYAEIL